MSNLGRRLADGVEGGFHAQGWQVLGARVRHRALRGPRLGDGSVGQRDVASARRTTRSTARVPRSTPTMDEGKRKELFVEFQRHMYDNAVAMKAGNYGHVPGCDRES